MGTAQEVEQQTSMHTQLDINALILQQQHKCEGLVLECFSFLLYKCLKGELTCPIPYTVHIHFW